VTVERNALLSCRWVGCGGWHFQFEIWHFVSISPTFFSISSTSKTRYGVDIQVQPVASNLEYHLQRSQSQSSLKAMSFTANLEASPVAAAFSGIQWDPLGKLKLTDAEKSILRSGEDNPVDYTLSNVEDACMYARALLKVLAESSGPSGPSVKVSKIKKTLPADDALQLLYTDPTGKPVILFKHLSFLKDSRLTYFVQRRRYTLCYYTFL
jgi:hypothetical protein